MKKIILPLAFVTAGAVTAGFVGFHSNRAVADIPNDQLEIGDGKYFIDGNYSNNDLYIVVEDGTIRFQSDTGDLRDAFKDFELNSDEQFRVSEESLERQLDLTMSDWGGTYDYVLETWGNATDSFLVRIKNHIDENGEPQGDQGFIYYIDKKAFQTWMGDYVLYEG